MNLPVGPIVVGVIAIVGGIVIFINRAAVARDTARRQQRLGYLGREASRGAMGRTVGAVGLFISALGLVILAASIFASSLDPYASAGPLGTAGMWW